MSAQNQPKSAPPPVREKESQDPDELKLKRKINFLLRDVRVEIEEIMRLIEQHVAGELDIFQHVDELVDSKADVDRDFAELKGILENREDLRNDTNSKIINIWELAAKSPCFDAQSAIASGGQQKDQERLRELNLLKSRLERLTFVIVYATGMDRLNNWISKARPGYALPFHAIFEDELQSETDRLRMLGLYSLAPKRVIGGLIDVTKGVVFCYPLNPFARVLRHLINFLQMVMWFALVYWVTDLLANNDTFFAAFNLGADRPKTGQSLVLFWTALLLGILAHVLVAGAKVPSASFRQFPLPLRDWDFYLSARTSVVMYKSALAFLVFWAMFFSLKGDMGLFEAFLIGYSFDSVVELVGLSLEKRAQTNLSAIKGKLGVSG